MMVSLALPKLRGWVQSPPKIATPTRKPHHLSLETIELVANLRVHDRLYNLELHQRKIAYQVLSKIKQNSTFGVA